MFLHYSLEGKTGVRWWWHFGNRCVFRVEFYWWSRHCHAHVDVDDDGWTWALALPPLAVYLSFDGFPAWKPRRKCIATWDNNREFWLTDQRTCGVTIHDWSVWIKPWSKTMEWANADPWWVRGVTLNIPDLILGRSRCETEVLRDGIPVTIPMPEGIYSAFAKIERRTWKRPRWFAHSRVSTWIDIPKGIPFQGKGENSWDCGDDGLFGTGADGDSIPVAVTKVRESVLRSRRRYGAPSEKAIREALA